MISINEHLSLSDLQVFFKILCRTYTSLKMLQNLVLTYIRISYLIYYIPHLLMGFNTWTHFLMRNIEHFYTLHSFYTFGIFYNLYPRRSLLSVGNKVPGSSILQYLLDLSYFLTSPPAQSYKNSTFYIIFIPFIPFELLP